jgi:hypothetical protein
VLNCDIPVNKSTQDNVFTAGRYGGDDNNHAKQRDKKHLQLYVNCIESQYLYR